VKVLERTQTKRGNEIILTGNNIKDGVLIIGVFHGDEPQGKYLTEQYIAETSSKRDMSDSRHPCNLLFIPCLNPDGMAKNTRTNSNGVDLNRNFPTNNWGQNPGDNTTCDDNAALYYGGKHPASETETKFVIDIVEKYKPKCILTLHAPYKVVNYDGPAEQQAQAISKITGYPVQSNIGYPTPGSFGTYCGIERSIPTITLELDEKIPVKRLIPPVFRVFDYLNGDFYAP